MHDRLQIQIVRMTERLDHNWNHMTATAASRPRRSGHTWNMTGRAAGIVRHDGGDG